MIPIPSGWRAQRDGDALVLLPPDDTGGFVRYVERVRPLASLTAIAERILAGTEVLAIDEPELIETDEGEYAARLSAVTQSGRREIGIVLVDDFYAVIDAHVENPDALELFRSTVDRLTRADVHALGERRRWYRHAPPAGWRSRRRGSETIYESGGERPIAITMWHAMPRRIGSSSELLATAMFEQDADAGFALIDATTEQLVRSETGLSGSMITIRGNFPDLPVTERVLVALEDAGYVYMLKLETAGGLKTDDMAVLADLVASIRPLPNRRGEQLDAFYIWAA